MKKAESLHGILAVCREEHREQRRLKALNKWPESCAILYEVFSALNLRERLTLFRETL